MSLSPGDKLGPYQIITSIGAGGMGQVYRARDTRLGRDVAIKVSQDRFSDRFELEARAVAALNHPNICHLYDIGPNYLVMEYIDGRSLGVPLPIADAIRYASHIADALDAAHAKGIIHRDIKPANVMITSRGDAKVLDFGLAKQSSKADNPGTDAATELMLTARGSAVGTIAYMSPEQALGQTVDGRTDIWALGVMLYEMVTGTRPFQGATQASIFDAILNRTPVAPSILNPDVPPSLEQVILKATEKDRALRYLSAADLLVDLKRIQRDSATGTAVAQSSSAPPTVVSPSRRIRYYSIAALLVIAAIGGAILALRAPKKPVAERSGWQQITNFNDTATDPALSPDGRMLTFKRGGGWFMSHGQIYVKMLPDGQAVQLTHDDRSKMAPAFSPDGSRILYSATDQGWTTWEVPVLAGGEPHRMLANAEGLRYIDSRHILFSQILQPPLMAIEVSEESRSGIREIYVPPTKNGMAHFSAISPDHKQVLVVEMDLGWIPCRVVPFDGSSRGRQVGPVPSSCTSAAWSPDGKWMYFTANTGSGSHIWRQRTEGGPPEQISSGPTTEEGIAVAPDGRSLITSAATSHSSIWLHDSNGDRQMSSEGNAAAPCYSPEGDKVYFLAGSLGGQLQLWAFHLSTGRSEPVLPGVAVGAYSLSPDGKALAYFTIAESGGDRSLWYTTLDQRSTPRKLVASGVMGLTRLGRSGMVYYTAREGQSNAVYRIAIDGAAPIRITNEGVRVNVSPDEQWVTRATGERDTGVIVVSPVAGGPAQALCSRCLVGWSPDGKSVTITLQSLMGAEGVTAIIPLPSGKMLPPLPPEGIQKLADLKKIPGVQIAPWEIVSAGPSGFYAYKKNESVANLFRVPLP